MLVPGAIATRAKERGPNTRITPVFYGLTTTTSAGFPLVEHARLPTPSVRQRTSCVAAMCMLRWSARTAAGPEDHLMEDRISRLGQVLYSTACHAACVLYLLGVFVTLGKAEPFPLLIALALALPTWLAGRAALWALTGPSPIRTALGPRLRR
jgi:hypothetical protein